METQSPEIVRARINPFAVISLVFGCLWIGGMGSVIALSLGLFSRAQIRRSEPAQRGEGLAIAGIALGAAGILLAVVVLGPRLFDVYV